MCMDWGARRSWILTLLLISLYGCAGGGTEKPEETPHAGYHVGYAVHELAAAGDDGKPLRVAVWYPTADTPEHIIYGGPTGGEVAVNGQPLKRPAGYPLLVFSHGYGGSGLGSLFLTEYLASLGWVVMAPDHHDRFSAVRIGIGQVKDFDRLGFYRDARQIGRSGPEQRGNYFYRLDELQRVMDWALETGPYAGLVNHDQVAVGGHSLGGFTALGLCGTLPERQDPRIKALLLFSTGAGAYLYRGEELARVKLPTLYLYGEKEREQGRGEHNMQELADKLYRKLAHPMYMLEVKGGTHTSFNNRFSDRLGARILSGSEEEFEVIRHYAAAFLQTYVEHKDGLREQLVQPLPMISHLQHK
jgi:predicted dienelactone hydrolase